MIYSTTLYKKISHKAIPLSNRLGRFDRFTRKIWNIILKTLFLSIKVIHNLNITPTALI